MTFNPLIPQGPDLISLSQGQLLTNNTALESWSEEDHISLTDAGARKGRHNEARFQKREDGGGMPENITTQSDEVGIWSKEDTDAVLKLFFRRQSDGTINALTDIQIQSAANAGTMGGTTQYIDTPWKIRVLWLTGSIASGGGGSTWIMPAGTGGILTLSGLASDASTAVTGANIAGGPAPQTVIFYAQNPIGARVFALATV